MIISRQRAKDNPHKFAIIRLGGWADAARLGFMADSIRERYPNAHVTFVTGKGLKDWAYCMRFDSRVFINTKGLHSKYRLVRLFKQVGLFFTFLWGRYDVAISLHDSMNFGWALRFAGCRRAIGIKMTEDRRPAWLSGFHDMIPRKEGEGNLDFYLRLMKEIDVNPTTLRFNVQARQSTHDLTMKRLNIFKMRPKQYLVLGPGEGEGYPRHFTNKKWPYYREFLFDFMKLSDWPVLLLGELSDGNLVLPLIEVDHHRIHSWVAQASREQMLVALNQAGAYIGCDSGLSHVAGCIGLPSVVLFGPSHSKQVQPPGQGKTLVALNGQVPCSPCYKLDGNFNWGCMDNACMKTISPKDVLGSLKQIAPQAFNQGRSSAV